MILTDKTFMKCRDEFANTRKLSDGGIEFLFKCLFRLGKSEETMIARREEYEQSTKDNYETYLKRTADEDKPKPKPKANSGTGNKAKGTAGKRKPAARKRTASKTKSTASTSKTKTKRKKTAAKRKSTTSKPKPTNSQDAQGRAGKGSDSKPSEDVVPSQDTKHGGVEHVGSISVTRSKYKGTSTHSHGS